MTERETEELSDEDMEHVVGGHTVHPGNSAFGIANAQAHGGAANANGHPEEGCPPNCNGEL